MGVDMPQMPRRARRLVSFYLWSLAITAWLVSACGLSPGALSPGMHLTPTFTPFQPLLPTSVPTTPPQPTATPTLTPPAGLTLWVDPRLPPALGKALTLPPEITLVERPEQAVLRLEFGGEHPLSHWVYALVAPFPTLEQGVSLDDLRNSWGGNPAGAFGGQPLLLDEGGLAALSALWGAPAEGAVKVLPSQELLDYAWEHRPAWAAVPFEALEPRWKVLEVDGLSPLRKEFDPSVYPLSVPISLDGEPHLVEMVRQVYGEGSPTPLLLALNRDPRRLTVVVLTGVTALVRATAYTMEQRGVKYPARDIGEWLRSADLTHISNEVPFAKNCPFPNPVQPDLRFCSDPHYIALLEEVGTDIVELTGDHFQDWGEEAMLYTLDLYRQQGWGVYGGGANLEEGRRPLLIEHNGNRLAFMGCNAKGGAYAQAGPRHPGAVACDMDWMAAEVARLREEGYLPIVTFQHYEYYQYAATHIQKRDFGRMAQAGAVIVSGSQAHQPQALEFVDRAFIHYGLGNMFFDQYEVCHACRQAFVDRHVFYNGRYIGTELLTMMFVDYARPRPMTPGERDELLRAVFNASGW